MRAIICSLLLITTLVLAVTSQKQLNTGGLQTLHEWTYIDFTWTPQEKAVAIKEGRYNASRVVPMDADMDRAGRVFLSFLGNQETPAIIGVVTKMVGSGGPLIQPYPSWSWFVTDKCDTIQNVFRFKIDSCNRLWVLDHGKKDGLSRKCPPKLVLFNLDNNKHMNTFVLPKSMLTSTGDSLFVTPAVDTEGQNCERTTVYLADADGNSLLVLRNGLWYRYEHPTFKPNPAAVQFQSGNDRGELHGGLVGLAVSPRNNPWERKRLFYRPLNSFVIDSIDISGLKRNYIEEWSVYRSGDVLSSQAIAIAFSKQGTLFFGLTKENAIACWNMYKPLNKQNIGIVDMNLEKYQYLTGVKVIQPSPAHPQEELLLLSNRFVGFRTNTLKPSDVKYRVIKGPVKNLIGNGVCSLSQRKIH